MFEMCNCKTRVMYNYVSSSKLLYNVTILTCHGPDFLNCGSWNFMLFISKGMPKFVWADI